jgi:hypothetical protein
MKPQLAKGILAFMAGLFFLLIGTGLSNSPEFGIGVAIIYLAAVIVSIKPTE